MNQSSNNDGAADDKEGGGASPPPEGDYLELAQASPRQVQSQQPSEATEALSQSETQPQPTPTSAPDRKDSGLLMEPLLHSQTLDSRRTSQGLQDYSMELARFGGNRSSSELNNAQNSVRRTGDLGTTVSSSQAHDTQSMVSGMSRMTQRTRMQTQGIKLKLEQSWFDRLKIFLYHCIEPALLASAISFCLQLPTLTTLLYVVLMFLGILPLTLSSNQTNIKFKWFLCILMLFMAVPLSIWKGVMIYKYQRDPTKFDQKPDLWQFLGIFGDKPALTVVIDIIQISICMMLIWHYGDQRLQAGKRLTVLGRLEFQTEIKLHHPHFGRKWQFLLTVTFLIFLLDTFIMLSIPQLVVISLMIFIMFAWRALIESRSKALTIVLRIIQVLLIAQTLTSFTIQLPIVQDIWRKEHDRVLHLLGLAGLKDEMPYIVYARIHYVVASIGVVCTELVAVSVNIEELRQQRIEQQAVLSQNLQPPTFQPHTSILNRTRFTRSRKINQMDRSASSALMSSNITTAQVKLFHSSSPSKDYIERQSRMNRSANLVKSRPTEEKTCWARFKTLWDDIHASSALLIWICRSLAFLWAYCYHDWQSVLLLTWIVHSTLYQKTSKFKKWMLYFYMPLITAIFIWYYVINIFGLIPWDNYADQRKTMYTYGFFQFQVPTVEIAFMFTALFFFCRLTIQLSSGSKSDKKFEQHLNNQIGNKNGSLFYQFLFLFLVYIEYPLMLFLVFAGLDKMDIYHITMLFFFVWYTLKPSIIKNNSIYLLVYADLFVLEKYIYTMFDTAENPKNWIEVMGFSTDFDRDSTQEYFRYKPRFDQWLLVFLTFCLYRRQEILGIYDGDRFDEYREKAQNQIKLRMPRLYQLYIYVDIVYTYTIVITAFTLYLVISVLIKACLINAITQTLVLILLLIYLNQGIRKLMRYWNMLIVYQAVVLVLMVSFQFMVQTRDFATSDIKAFFDSWPTWLETWWHWLGFEKFDNPINLKLLPYVIFFSLAVILAKNFKSKLSIEQRQLYTYEDVEDCSQLDAAEAFNSGAEKERILTSSFRSSNRSIASAELDRGPQMEGRSRKLEQLMRQDPTGDYKTIEPVLIFNYGKLSGSASQSIEILHHKQVRTMRYKLSYMTYKMQKAWPVIDCIAAYFYLLLYVTILAFALYYQLAVFWGLALTIYMAAQIINSKQNYQYRRAGSKIFVEKLNDQAAARLDKTEKEELAFRQSVFLIKQQKRKDIDELRESKGVVLQSQVIRHGVLLQKAQSNRLSSSAEGFQPRLTGRFGEQSFEQGRCESREASHSLTNNAQVHEADPAVGHPSVGENSVLDQLEAENKDNRRLKITDEEVITELNSFNEQIHKVSLKSRYFAWFSLMILLIIGLTMTYITSFANVYNEHDGGESPFSDETRHRIIFLFFWCGVYNNSEEESYAKSTYPFYVVMLLLIFERLAQIWIETHNGCDEELIRKFRSIEREDVYYMQLAREKKKAIERRSERRGVSFRRTHSRMIADRRISMVSSVTESNESAQDKQNGTDDSLRTDPDLRSKSTDQAALLAIEEETKQADESFVAPPNRSFSESAGTNKRDVESEGEEERSNLQEEEKEKAGSKHTSINQSYRESFQDKSLPTNQLLSDADRLIRGSASNDGDDDESKYDLTIIPESKEIKTSLSSPENQLSEDIDPWDKREEKKQKLLNELKPLLNINSKLRLFRAIKQMLENLCILLVWFSCIYKQNVFSMLLFFFLVIYTYHRSGNTLLAVRSTVVVLFVVQYWLEVVNLSSYNSPKSFPSHLLSSDTRVYPSEEQFYYDIPFLLSYNQTVDSSGESTYAANLDINSYMSMDAGSRKLNGIWIDFSMTVAVAIYFSLCNFWVLFRPIKVQNSMNTNKKLEQFAKLLSFENGKPPQDIKHLKRLLKQRFGMSKCIKSWAETLYLTFPILLIAFTLAISIFNKSILSFGYIIFVMILVFDNIHFLKHRDGQNRMLCILRYFMLPYLLVDILLQLIYQMPLPVFQQDKPFSQAIGFDRFWCVKPDLLKLGDDTDVTYEVEASLTTMMLKGVTFFFITIQLQLISSFGYQKFMQSRLEKELDQTRKVGQGITYRFNNFKSKAVLKQAKETQSVERMLYHVKRLIRKRDQLYKDAHRRKNSAANFMKMRERRHSADGAGMFKITEVQEGHSDSDSEQTYHQRLDARIQSEKSLIRKDYDKRTTGLSCCNKLYLWLRRNWVVDILFRQSEEQLDDIVYQMKSGRTSVKTQIEIGLNNQARKDRQFEVEKQLSELVEKQISVKRVTDTSFVKIEFADDLKTKSQTQKARVVPEEPESPPDKGVDDEPSSKLKNGMASPQTLSGVLQTMEVRDSEEFNKKLDNLMDNIDDTEKQKIKADKMMLADLLKSKIFRPASKPWEAVNMETFLSWQLIFKRFVVVTYKTLMSYSELFCYLMMLLATLMKAGLLYMVYPVSIFGYCMLEEQRPGRIYWFSILAYTSFLIIFNFVIQLQLWPEILSAASLDGLNDFFNSNKLGVHHIPGDSFGDTFLFYFPEIFILFTVLIHIQKESLSGVFNVPYERYENFEAGLLRYRLHVLCNTEAERKHVTAQFQQEEALTIKLDKKSIDEYREKDGNLSEGDKFKRSEQLGEPIRIEKREETKLPLMPNALASIDDFILRNTDSNQLVDLNLLLDYEHQEGIEGEGDLIPDDESQIKSVQSEDNIVYKNRGKARSRINLTELARYLVWDNPFMRRLFPEIKQQKPGVDLYVYVATIQIILIIYIFVCYSNMQGNETDIATQFASNQYSSDMVVVIIIMIFIMVIDRVLYSTHAFMSGSNPKFDQSPTLLGHQDTQGASTELISSGDTSLVDADVSMLHRQSGQPYGRKQQALYSVDDGKKEFNKKNNWIEEQFAVSDDSDDNADEDLFGFNQYLIPQKQQKSCARVIKFYWFWVVICCAHFFVFFHLPSTVAECKGRVQLDKETNEYIYYDDPRYKCNTFTNNGFIITFYLLLCVYFFVQAYQMRIGLPEIRKGSFLMDTFNPVSGVIYRGYLAIPFIFELRTLIDWTFTTTSLDAFQWIKLAQIQANMFVAKCVNKDYMERKLGQRIKKWEKIVVGFGLMLFIILMIVGPIVLFSSLNPIAQLDNPIGGTLKATLSISDTAIDNNQTLPLFTTNQVTQIKPLTQEQWNALDLGDHPESTGSFELNQTRVLQFSETSDYAWIISQPKKASMQHYLEKVANNTLEDGIEIAYTLLYTFDRQDPKYGPATGSSYNKFGNDTASQELAKNLTEMLNCDTSGKSATFPADVTITQKTNSLQSSSSIKTGEQAYVTSFTLGYFCDEKKSDLTNNYWKLSQTFTDNPDVHEQVKTLEQDVFQGGDGFGFILFQQKVLPSFFSDYSTNLIVFYIGVVFVVATIFRSVFVPRTWEIYIIDAPFTEDILKICQSIHVYRVQRELEKEEELYQILIDIMRSPEMIKALCGSSLKKKLD